MHEIVIAEIESHLDGSASDAFYDHLKGCPDCMQSVRAVEQTAVILQDLRPRPDNAPAPLPGFYHAVAARIAENERSSGWNFFSPGPAFFRRVAFASLLLLAGLGSFLVTRESSSGGTDAAAIMAQHDVQSVHSESDDHDRLLVTLATYRQ